MENDSPNLFDSEPMSVKLNFHENTADNDDILTEILEEIREEDHRPPVVKNVAEATDSIVDEPLVDTVEYHTDDSDDEDGHTAEEPLVDTVEYHTDDSDDEDGPPADADPDQSTGSRKEDSPGAKTKDVHRGLPPGRVKLIMKMDPDVNIVAGEAVFLVTKATEQFVSILAQHCHKAMVATNKKTLQKKHIDAVIEDNVPFEFLEGTLDW
ncbi:LOW QUALITY PROTEIN: DNA polymerase epsilon subunit 4-like [Metopolophium dirhodum]|uniref:LOW QUALITY PROTEIN: DNA polymerase epsilon subunit 4-like n=1 Tax=Metopolophium dirhodum TaxID=44670 RepID=UPI00298FE165|nr:LOW QUALITY PROTEIN: DNA polymerase epsilon subunit 4-like [Metopolophium dirhodum]